MMKITLFSLLIAEVTLIGIMTIKKSALSSSLLVPLCWMTILFAIYLEQEHYKVSHHLPSTVCKKIDVRNHVNGMDKGFLKGKYIQPALKEKYVQPDVCLKDEEIGYDKGKSILQNSCIDAIDDESNNPNK